MLGRNIWLAALIDNYAVPNKIIAKTPVNAMSLAVSVNGERYKNSKIIEIQEILCEALAASVDLHLPRLHQCPRRGVECLA